MTLLFRIKERECLGPFCLLTVASKPKLPGLRFIIVLDIRLAHLSIQDLMHLERYHKHSSGLKHSEKSFSSGFSVVEVDHVAY